MTVKCRIAKKNHCILSPSEKLDSLPCSFTSIFFYLINSTKKNKKMFEILLLLDTHKNRIFSLTNLTAQILKRKRINSLTLTQPSEIDEIGISLMKWTTINLIDAACGRFQINNDRNAPTWRKLTKEQKIKLLLVSLKVGRSVCLKIGKQIPQID